MWAGGKNKMIPKYQETPGIPYSGYDTYVEPFFGGGAMMIHIYENNPAVKHFVLNDINPEIVGLYYAIRDDIVEFVAECDNYCNHYLQLDKSDRKKYYYQIRKEYTTQYQTWSATKESATLYFLMKTAFNGIWQSTKEAKGRFCTPSGLLNHKDKVYDKQNVMEWHKFLQKVSIHSGQWKDCCDNIQGRALYFFDPPYRDSFTQYGTDFDDARHLELIDFCKTADQAGHLVMYCNREAGDDFYTKNQGQLEIGYYNIKYTAGRRATETVIEEGKDNKEIRTAKSAKEILLYSPAITAMNCTIVNAKPIKTKKSKIADPSMIEYEDS
jgi:DNA adenine methylase